MALSFVGINAQKKKTTKKKKAKTTKVQAKKEATKPAENAADMSNVDNLVNAYAEPAEDPADNEPITSLSILNAKSPAAFRKYRALGEVKKGDSIISVKNKPLSYGYINDKDVFKSITVWEIIDLNDRINQPIYHNNDGLVTTTKSLYQVLFDAIMDGKIKQVYDDDQFSTKLAPDAIKQRVSYEFMSDAGKDREAETGRALTPEEAAEFMNHFQVKTENVKLIKIKGMWYIDRRDGQMKYRMLGIAAMGKDPTTMGQVGPDGQPLFGDDSLVDLFWLWYPDAREVLANSIVFNAKNNSSDITFDDILNARRFSSIIYKSDNGMGTGVIQDYIPSDANGQLEESDRIKASILQMENDMWNY